nr:hypothetical protein HK105_000453 [Polyrhizophydium stewartii]
MLDVFKSSFEAASKFAGPLEPAFKIVLFIIKVADDVKANKGAAAALARRSALLVESLQRQLADSHNEAVRRNIQAVEDLLSAIERFLRNLSTKNAVQQVLCVTKTAAAIKDFDGQITVLAQRRLSVLVVSLQLALAMQTDAVAKAIMDDTAALPELMEQLTSTVNTKFDVQQRQLETLQAIVMHQSELLERLPSQLQGRVGVLLNNTKQHIIASSGRGLSAVRDWSVDPDDVDIFWDSKIGEGGFGKIYRGRWDDKPVAVKVIDAAKGAEAIESIEKEATVWYPLRDANVLQLYRVCLNVDKPFILMPLMVEDVSDHLMKHADAPIEVRTGFLLGIARGMKYLHERPKPIIHGDLKANNVLIGPDGEVRITDFGLAFIKTSSSANTARRTGAVRWIAPEKYQRGYTPTTASDVFAFAMTAFQILTGKVPFAEEMADDVVKDWIKDGERPTRPRGVPDVLWQIVEDCWAHDPEARPTFRNIAARLNVLPTEKPLLAPDVVADLSADVAALSIGEGNLPSKPMSNPPALPPKTSSTSSDADVLVEVFGDWCRAKGLTRDTIMQFRDTVELGRQRVPIFIWNREGRVVSIMMAGQGIAGPISSAIRGLEYLRVLSLADNLITELPESIGDLPQLMQLDVHGNKLTRLPLSITRLTKLTDLLVHMNHIGYLPDDMGKMSGLTKLNFRANQIRIIPPSIGNIEGLKILCIGENMITDLPPTLGQLLKLTHFEARNCQLTVIPEWFGRLVNLTALEINNNQLTQLPNSLGCLTQLTTLTVASNFLSALPDSIGHLQKLNMLDVTSNRLTQLTVYIGYLIQLRTLSLNVNKLVQLPMTIGNLRMLKTLWLGNNALTRLPPTMFNLTSLVDLRLDGNPVHPAHLKMSGGLRA